MAYDHPWPSEEEISDRDERDLPQTWDARVENHGSLFLIQPYTVKAAEWISEHTADDAIYWAGALVVEPRYAQALVEGMREAGLKVS